MSAVALPPLSPSPARARWDSLALLIVIALSACTAPLFDVNGVTLTGDRLLGLAAVALAAVVGLREGLHWTAIHTALAAFAAVQVLTSFAAAGGWPAGPRFASVYVLGWACFAVAAEWARGPGGPWRAGRQWIAIGAVLGLLGSALAVAANYWQVELWGTGRADWLHRQRPVPLVLFASKLTFDEWNLYSSFLLVAFALALWWWRPGSHAAGRRRLAFLAVSAIALGLIFGMTRAAWIGMAAIVGLWLWARRPGWRPAAAVAGVVLLGFTAQTLAIGRAPLYWRVIKPLEKGRDRNINVRLRINEATLDSWRGEASAAPGKTAARGPQWVRRALGGGAGSTNSLQIQLSSATPVKPWNGNLVLFVLHDSGLLGLMSLAGVVAVVTWLGRRALRRTGDGDARGLLVALLGAGATLLFAYQFTHGLWLMYPYVYLGLLTAAIDSTSPRIDAPAAR